jgi:hypothetical protein
MVSAILCLCNLGIDDDCDSRFLHPHQWVIWSWWIQVGLAHFQASSTLTEHRLGAVKVRKCQHPKMPVKKFEGRGRSRPQTKFPICPQITSKVKLTLGKSFLFLWNTSFSPCKISSCGTPHGSDF